MSKLDELKNKASQLDGQVNQAQEKLSVLIDKGAHLQKQISPYFNARFLQNQRVMQDLISSLSPTAKWGWKDPQWSSWEAKEINSSELALIRCGEQFEPRSLNKFIFPAFAPFIGQNRTVIIENQKGDAKKGESIFQSLLMRTALMLQYRASFTLLDPANHGAAFPMRRYLPFVRQNGDDVRRDLDGVIADIRRVVETYLDATVTSFDQIPEEMRINERYQLVFAADFPYGYDRRAIEALQSIGNTGPRAGVYVFVHHNHEHELPRDISMAEFRNAFSIDTNEDKRLFKGHAITLIPDEAPSSKVQESVFATLSKAAPKEHSIDWDAIVGLPHEQWWQQSSASLIETPIGRYGAASNLRFWVGENKEGRPCVHGILGAMPGAGKSSFFHTLLTGLAIRYSPEELRMYLIDGKNGVEFQPYTDLPHAQVVSLLTAPELARSVLKELLEEMRRRNEIFAQNNVRQISDYRRFAKMARILLVVDEYQMLFEDDKQGIGSASLRTLSEQGRNVGIHILLASQRFGAAGMLGQTAIFGNIHIRMAMKMAESDIRALTEFQSKGKALISATCNLPGKIVVNDQGGDDSANVAGKVAWMSLDRHSAVLKDIKKMASALSPDTLPRTVVFNGNAQPLLTDNPQFRTLVDRTTWMNPNELSIYARKPAVESGPDVQDWFPAQKPALAWLGQEYNVHGHAKIVLKRRSNENIVLAGSDNAVRFGMLAAIMNSMAAALSPDALQFLICDRSIEDSEWGSVLRDIVDRVLKPSGFLVEYERENQKIEETFKFCSQEIERRRMLTDVQRAAEPELMVVITDLDKSENFRRRSDSFGLTESISGSLLKRVCVDGPALGIHLILSFDGMSALVSVLDDRQDLRLFKHRVALQMYDYDSFRICNKPDASHLQDEGPLPVSALYIDGEKGQMLRFKPYSIKFVAGTMTFSNSLTTIGEKLSARRKSHG